MNVDRVDTLAKRLASATSRRSSLLTMSAGLAAIGGIPLTGAAKKKHKKNDKDKKCRRQEGQCNAFFGPLCADEDAPEDCVELMATCCDHLAQCQATAYLDCLFEIIFPPAPQ